jgi:hypothetical protein
MKYSHLSVLGTLAVVLFTGCASLPKHMTTTTRLDAPPPGKALINFHRPTSYGKNALYPIFDGEGKFICDMPGNSVYQYPCPPGRQLFIGWAEQVSVVDADVAADKTYDVMIDVTMGWVQTNIKMVPLTKGEQRRAKLDQFEKKEKSVLAIQDTKHVRDYEARNKERIQEIKKDFLEGKKSDRVRRLSPDDCR